jgi:hypothetical protein
MIAILALATVLAAASSSSTVTNPAGWLLLQAAGVFCLTLAGLVWLSRSKRSLL